MSTKHGHRGLWTLTGLVCLLSILWGLGIGHGPDLMVEAQQDNWTTEAARRIGVRLLETRDASGPAAYQVAPGDLLFFTNSGPEHGAMNERNSIVVIDAKSKKPIAISDLEPGWSQQFISHGMGVSPDGRYVYLPGQAPRTSKNPSSILVLDARTLKIKQIIASGAERPHHLKNYEDWTGKQRVLVEDFNWPANSPNGKGFFVLDPYDDNKVVAGLTPGDLRGNPYAGFTAPDGRYLYYSMPAPDPSVRSSVNGLVVKIDMQTWKVVQYIPMQAYPIWTVFSLDGKYAWVTQAGSSKLLKIERATAPGQRDKVVGEVPTGPGPYGAAMSIDDKEIWVADKGEDVPGAQKRTTVTVIDADTNQAKHTIEAKCAVNDHIMLSPDGQEMWASCNGSLEIVVMDAKTHQVKARVPMPNLGDPHGGSFVSYSRGPDGGLVAETVSDQNGLHGSARSAAMKHVAWMPGAR